MISFEILRQSKKSRARLGRLTTPHGIVQTPTLVPVATQGVIKTLWSEQVELTKSQMLIANTFHLHERPGEKVIKAAGGLHKFMNWSHPIMTDSAGYQVFSFGFGKDLGVGKIMKGRPSKMLDTKAQPRNIKITDEGVEFCSHLDGRKLFIGPRESIRIQEKLGADIMLAFDECTPPQAGSSYTKKSLERTHAWANMSLQSRRTKQALYGIVQGGKYERLRRVSAQFIGGTKVAGGFDGFAIGGEFGSDKKTMSTMVGWCLDELPVDKPRHLLGIGQLEDLPIVIKAGVDTFDCIVPTHYARRGIAFTRRGRLDLGKAMFLRDARAIDATCQCFVCARYTRRYLTHLFRAREISAMGLVTFHNLHLFNTIIEEIREKIADGTF